MIENDYLITLKKTTNISSEEHFRILSEEYFSIGASNSAEKSIKRSLKIAPDDLKTNLVLFSQLLSNTDLTDAETLIQNLIGRNANSVDLNFRLLCLFKLYRSATMYPNMDVL